MDSKICNTCNVEKDLSKFPVVKKSGKVYYRSKCYACTEKARRQEKTIKQVLQETPDNKENIVLPIIIDKQNNNGFKRTYIIQENNIKKLHMLKSVYPIKTTFDELINLAIEELYNKNF